HKTENQEDHKKLNPTILHGKNEEYPGKLIKYNKVCLLGIPEDNA
ncbi:300_t:CDS:2, partial [Gigaspora rosea]